MRLAFFSALSVIYFTLLSECSAIAYFGRDLKALPRLHNKDSNSTTTPSAKKHGKKEVVCIDGVCHVRGGALYDEDEYDDEYDEEELPPPARRRPPNRSRAPPPASRRRPPPHERRGPPPGRRGPPPGYRRGPRPRQPSILNSAAGLAKKTVGLTTSAAVGTVKGSGKAAFYLVSPKHVSRREVWGVWRLDQQGIVHS